MERRLISIRYPRGLQLAAYQSRSARAWRLPGHGFGRPNIFTILTLEQIATRQKCSVRQVNMTISLAFLAPGLVKAAVEGRLPRGIGVERLRDAPAEWSRQFESLGLNPQ